MLHDNIINCYDKQLQQLLFLATGESEQRLKTITIPYIGDQLTRVQFEKAKKARHGDDLETNRQFEILNPFIIAMWHTKQDFVEVSFISNSILIRVAKSLVTSNWAHPIDTSCQFLGPIGVNGCLLELKYGPMVYYEY